MSAAPAGPVILARAGESAGVLLARAGLRGPRPVIVVCGGADEMAEPQLTAARRALGPALSAAAALTGAAVVDGATAAGVMALVGAERARDPAAMPVLLGVAPAGMVEHDGERGDGRVGLEHNHTHVVLADSDVWGGETPLLMALAEELAQDRPIVMVVAGGGAGTRAELREGAARRWPVLVVEGTGGVAAEVAAAVGGDRGGRVAQLAVGAPAPSPLQDELRAGDVRVVRGDGPDALRRVLAWELQGDSSALKDAWALFATYDALATGLRRGYERFQRAILLLGIVATAVALAHDSLGWELLHVLAIALPLVASVVFALANRRATGRRWVLLRAAAEAVKSEIYRYRTQTGVYAPGAQDPPPDPPQLLVQRLAQIDGQVVQSDASGGRLTPYAGPLPPRMDGGEAGDDGLSPLDAARYVEIRVADQLSYYRRKVDSLDRRREVLQVVAVVAGGAGAFVAAIGEEIWIGFTTAVAGACLAYLGYLQFDSTIVAYNQAAAQLAALQREFRVSGEELAIGSVVDRGEGVLMIEHAGWVQQMTAALERQRTEQGGGDKPSSEADARPAA